MGKLFLSILPHLLLFACLPHALLQLLRLLLRLLHARSLLDEAAHVWVGTRAIFHVAREQLDLPPARKGDEVAKGCIWVLAAPRAVAVAQGKER